MSSAITATPFTTAAAATATAKGIVSFWSDGSDGNSPQLLATTEVEILGETTECYRVRFPRKFKDKHFKKLNCAELIQKGDASRLVVYTEFTHTTDQPIFGDDTGRYLIMMPAPDGSDEDGEVLECNVIVETYPRHYRLRFPADFAAEHPNACNEWVSRDSANPIVEL